MIDKFSTVMPAKWTWATWGSRPRPPTNAATPTTIWRPSSTKTEAVARCMDEHGYRTLWLAEHHFQHEGYECLPNILMVGVHLAHLTTRLRIGCGFNIAPMWHPLRLAEDYATADILTKGRIVFGVGRGYHSARGRDLRRADARRRGQPRAVRGAGRDHHEGVHVRSPSRTGASTTRCRRPCPTAATSSKELTLVPRPMHQPVECWQPDRERGRRAASTS